MGRRIQVGDQIGSLGRLLQTSKDHLCPWDILFGVGKVDIQRVLTPDNAFLLIGFCVSESGGSASLPAPESPKIGSCLVLAAFLHRVALSASLDEQLLALLDVSRHPFCADVASGVWF